ncbi:MAG: hypothetical protein AAF725_22030, partial [Acidobacteriota bacterium]
GRRRCVHAGARVAGETQRGAAAARPRPLRGARGGGACCGAVARLALGPRAEPSGRLALGLGGTFLVRDLMSSFLYEVASIDWVSFVIGSIVLTTVGLLACFLPARRASHIDPIVALRHE